MRDALVRQLGDVHQAFQAAQVDEGAEVTHRADGSFQHRPDLELLAQLRGKPGPLLLQERAPREDGVPAADLHHPELELLADELRGVLDEAHVDLRGGNEGAQASQVHLEAALVLRGDRTLDRHPRLERLLEHLAAGPLGHRAGHHRRAVREGEHVGVDGLALLHQKLALVVAQLAQVDDRLALPSQVEVADLGADVRDARLHLLTEPQLLRLVRRLLALREERGEVACFVGPGSRECRLRHGARNALIGCDRHVAGWLGPLVARRRRLRRLVGLPERGPANHHRHLALFLARPAGRRRARSAILGAQLDRPDDLGEGRHRGLPLRRLARWGRGLFRLLALGLGGPGGGLHDVVERRRLRLVGHALIALRLIALRLIPLRLIPLRLIPSGTRRTDGRTDGWSRASYHGRSRRR